jgi:hypothetical protein
VPGSWSAVTEPDLIGLFVEPLEAIGVAYVITGGVACRHRGHDHDHAHDR